MPTTVTVTYKGADLTRFVDQGAIRIMSHALERELWLEVIRVPEAYGLPKLVEPATPSPEPTHRRPVRCALVGVWHRRPAKRCARLKRP
jgi:hypothetical protein